MTASLEALLDTAWIFIDYGAASSVVIAPQTDTIADIGGTVKLAATVLGADLQALTGSPVTWRSLDTGLAAVTADGSVTAISKGVARIAAKSGVAEDTAMVWIVPAPASAKGAKVTIAPKRDTIPNVGGSLKLAATVVDTLGQPITDQSVTWATLDAGIVEVGAAGLATGIEKGVARITAKQGALVDTAWVWVAPVSAAIGPMFVKIAPSLDTIPTTGGSVVLEGDVFDTQGARLGSQHPDWVSLDANVALVDGDASNTRVVTIRSVTAGSARIVARYGALSDTAVVKVLAVELAAQPAELVVAPKADTLASVGATLQLTATVTDASGGVLTEAASWSSLDAAVASVSSTGLVTAVSS
ncbi:MAG: Ig-like domain-containing protein, partial [Longimicrobiales bacterium]